MSTSVLVMPCSLRLACPARALQFGFERTLTSGVVSALGRGFQSQTGSVIGGGIQTDAAGGPLSRGSGTR